MARTALVLALTGTLAVLSGGLLLLTAGSAGSVRTSDTPCVPSEAWTETTDWLLAPPGEGWRQVDERTVTDQPAWTEEVFVGWQHYSWTGGPLEDGVVPDPPTGPDDRDWQANTTHEPHQNNPNVTWIDDSGWGLHYTSHGSSGRADWFYLERVTEVVEHPAVTHQEYRYAFDHPAVVCPTEPPTTEPPTTEPPTTEPPTTEPPTTEPPTGQPTAVPPTTVTAGPSDEPGQQPGAEPEQGEAAPAEEPATGPTTLPDDVEVLGAQASAPQPPPAPLPTAVAAGLPGDAAAGAPGSGWGLVLLAGGSVLLATAGGVLGRVRRG